MNDNLKNKLKGFGFNDEQISKLETEQVAEESDLALFSSDEIKTISGCSAVAAKKVYKELHPELVIAVTTSTPATPAPQSAPVNIEAEIPAGSQPTPALMNQFANTLGIDQSILPLILLGNMAGGQGGGVGNMDLSSLIPVQQIVAGYNPKVRNLFLMMMGALQDSFGGVPIVVINSDGSVNREHTTQYILDLQDNLSTAEEDIYYDADSNPFDIIAVGVDAQGIFDADPLDSSKSLSRNHVGVGRVSWNNVPLDVRQVCYFAVKTGEINPANDSHLTWLRDHVKPGCNRFVFKGQAPKAVTAFNDANRTGSLPTLKVRPTRGPRKPETMPRRRQFNPSDLPGLTRTKDDL